MRGACVTAFAVAPCRLRTTTRLRRCCAAAAAAAGAPSQGALRVLITGSTKGLGYALANEFLASGTSTRVVLNSRDSERVAQATQQLQAKHGAARVCGCAADVAVADDVDALVQYAVSQLGGVDIWLNNAGSNGTRGVIRSYLYAPLTEAPPSALANVVATNLLGTLLCCRAAALLMATQPAGGSIFLMEGAGSDGNPTRKYAAYGCTKAALPQLARSLQAELSQDKPIAVHTISPGMVYTDLIACGKDAFGSSGNFFVNAFAEEAHVTARIIVPQVLALHSQTQQAGTPTRKVQVLTPLVAVEKLGRRLLFGQNKGRWNPE